LTRLGISITSREDKSTLTTRNSNDILNERYVSIVGSSIAQKYKQEQRIMEELTDIREKIRYGRKMNRRLHSTPFMKIQFYIACKSMEQGFKPELVNAKNTSRMCPICGEISKPNGHVFKCAAPK